MADKKEQEVQEVTTGGYEQIELFREQTPAEAAAETIAAIKRTLQEAEAIRNAPGYRVTDLLMKLDEAATLAERCSNPRAIRAVCEAAAADAAALAKSTGNQAFNNISERLTAVAAAAVVQQDAERHEIHINTDPDFDMDMTPAEWEKARAQLHAALDGLMKMYSKNMKQTAAVAMDAIKPASENVNGALSLALAFTQSEAFKALKESLAELRQYAEERRGIIIDQIATEFAETQPLFPFIQQEIDALNAANPDKPPITLDNVLACMAPNGEPIEDESGIENPYKDLIERAKAHKAEMDAAEGVISELEQITEELPRIQYKKTAELKTVTDKLANVFFSLTAPAAKAPAANGQRQMTPLRYEGRKSKKEITLFYDYDYNEEVLEKYGISKKFDDFDFFVMTTVDNLITAGNDVVSYTKIYNEMGGEGSPTKKQLEPIYYSLLKGLSTIITIDDAEARKAWKADASTYHEIVSPVIPVQLGNERFTANGKIANGFVKINGVSPFLQVAKSLGHITAWEKDILRLYSGRKTKRYYSVMRFLMLQIGWMRNGNRSHKISYSTLYQHTGDTTTRAQQLTRDMMYRLLDEVFKPADYITAYKEEADPTPGVVLTLSKNRLKIAGK